jgi:hypothetical protein
LLLGALATSSRLHIIGLASNTTIEAVVTQNKLSLFDPVLTVQLNDLHAIKVSFVNDFA